MIQVVNEGGLIWEGESSCASLDAALKAADEAIAGLMIAITALAVAFFVRASLGTVIPLNDTLVLRELLAVWIGGSNSSSPWRPRCTSARSVDHGRPRLRRGGSSPIESS
jgi:hypothetical protein